MRTSSDLWDAREVSDRDTELSLLDSALRGDSLSAKATSSRPVTVVGATRTYLNSWRAAIVLQIILAVAIFGLNLGLVIWIQSGFEAVKGVATVYEGSCPQIKATITGLHLAICVLGTLLLGASNYCMQILSAPTREEVDAAHAKHRWLSIGVPSVRNLWNVSRTRGIIWLMLGLSSIPLHLLWNSAVVNTLSANDFVYSAVTEDFLTGAPYGRTYSAQFSDAADIMHKKLNTSSLINMTVTDCMNVYRADLISQYGNVLLVYNTTSVETRNNSLIAQEISHAIKMDAGNWMCPAGNALDTSCNVDDLIRQRATEWNPWAGVDLVTSVGIDGSHFSLTGRVKYCLTEIEDHPCRLDVSPPILITVLLCNVVKIVCFILTLCISGSTSPLVTNGDTIESFLLRPDVAFKGRCLVSREHVNREKRFWSQDSLPLQWLGARRPWAAGATGECWLATFIPAIVLIIAIIGICVKNGVWAVGTAAVVAEGFGQQNTRLLVGGAGYQSPAAASLLSNLPQILVSYIYLAYNTLYTYMLSTAELVGYSTRPHFLGVQWPKGKQRSRGFLQLPYAYSWGLMTASTLLHWLISESLFLVRIAVFDYYGKETPSVSISSAGYSPYAIIFAVCFGGAMLIAVLLLAFLRKYPATMPLAACCSASIAAMCQPGEDMTYDDLTQRKLQWGVIGPISVDDTNTEVEHASFSAKDITPLVAGRTYA